MEKLVLTNDEVASIIGHMPTKTIAYIIDKMRKQEEEFGECYYHALVTDDCALRASYDEESITIEKFTSTSALHLVSEIARLYDQEGESHD